MKGWLAFVLHLISVIMCAWNVATGDRFWPIPFGFMALLFLGYFLANYLARAIVLHMAALSIELRRRADDGR
jgi:hypothetical protein